MIYLIVAMVAVAASVGVATYLRRKRERHMHAVREPVPLVFPLPSRTRQAEPFADRPIKMDVSTEVLGAGPKRAQLSTSDTVHFRRPSDEAIQLLPGRLEVLSGVASPREIRFVRVPGQRPQMILGREPGNSPQHVSLPSSTVSRQHARLDFSGGRWGLTNLSHTNPVVVNDETLSSVQGARALVDGDRIELGDVVLRFCAR